jgi:hypothetical protein
MISSQVSTVAMHGFSIGRESPVVATLVPLSVVLRTRARNP